MQPYIIIKTPLCTKVNVELIQPSQPMPKRYMSSGRRPLGPIRILDFLESNFKVDSISHYRESTELYYLM